MSPSHHTVISAAEYEARRQAEAVHNGETVQQETRTFDVKRRQTIPMRRKEGAVDYRFLPEPDLPPLVLNEKVSTKDRQYTWGNNRYKRLGCFRACSRTLSLSLSLSLSNEWNSTNVDLTPLLHHPHPNLVVSVHPFFSFWMGNPLTPFYPNDFKSFPKMPLVGSWMTTD